MRLYRIALTACLAISLCPAAPPAGRVIRLTRVQEPREGAFTMLVPEGWQTEGGVYRVDPSRAGGAGNSIAAKVDFIVRSDPSGRVMVRTLPDNLYKDMRGSPAAAMFPPGSNYSGMVVSPPMDALSYLANVVFRQARPQARNPAVLARVPLPAVAQSYDKVCRNMGLPADYRNDAAILLVAYEEGGVRFKEVLYTDVQFMLVGVWGNKDTYMARAPFDEFDRTSRLFRLMHESVKLNPRWMARELQSQLDRSRIVADVQNYVQKIDDEIVKHRADTNSAINSQIQMVLIDQMVEKNPHTGQPTRVPSNLGTIWYGKDGSAIYSEDPQFDPAKSRNYAGGGYEKAEK